MPCTHACHAHTHTQTHTYARILHVEAAEAAVMRRICRTDRVRSMERLAVAAHEAACERHKPEEAEGLRAPISLAAILRQPRSRSTIPNGQDCGFLMPSILTKFPGPNIVVPSPYAAA